MNYIFRNSIWDFYILPEVNSSIKCSWAPSFTTKACKFWIKLRKYLSQTTLPNIMSLIITPHIQHLLNVFYACYIINSCQFYGLNPLDGLQNFFSQRGTWRINLYVAVWLFPTEWKEAVLSPLENYLWSESGLSCLVQEHLCFVQRILTLTDLCRSFHICK